MAAALPDPLPTVWNPDDRIGDMLRGKRGLVVGIANQDSIAYGCAAKLRAFGAELAITWVNSTLALLRDVKPRRTSARPNVAVRALDFSRFVRVPANSDNRPATGSGSPPPLPTAPV